MEAIWLKAMWPETHTLPPLSLKQNLIFFYIIAKKNDLFQNIVCYMRKWCWTQTISLCPWQIPCLHISSCSCLLRRLLCWVVSLYQFLLLRLDTNSNKHTFGQAGSPKVICIQSSMLAIVLCLWNWDWNKGWYDTNFGLFRQLQTFRAFADFQDVCRLSSQLKTGMTVAYS